jgi:protease stability complex PrcB-like protein
MALFAVISCRPAVAPPVSEGVGSTTTAELRVLAKGSYGREGPDQPAVLVATSDAEFNELWQRYVGDHPPPVDFSRESAVFLLLGNRSTGGYSIEPQSVGTGEEEVRVEAPVTSPGRESIVTMALTAPFAVVAVPRAGVQSAVWMDGDRIMARGERKRR